MERDNLVQIIHLLADGKLDRLDMQILRLQSEESCLGYLRLSQMLGVPVSTVRNRINRMKVVLNKSQQ